MHARNKENADLLGSDPEKFDDNAKRLGELQEQAAKRATPPSDYPVESLKPGASSREDAPDYSFPASWPRTDEPKLAGHERRTVKIEMYAPTGRFS